MNDPLDLMKRAKEAEEGGQYMSASTLYRAAGALFRMRANSENFLICKKKIVDMIKLALEHEYKKYQVAAPVDEKRMKEHQAVLDEFSKLPLEDLLQAIGGHPFFTPTYQKTLALAAKTMPIMMALSSVSATDSRGNTIKGSFSGQKVWEAKMYKIDVLLKYTLSVFPLARKIIDEGRLTAENLVNYLNRFGILEGDNLRFVEEGIQAFFDGDYIKTLHVMIPQFETLLLSISGKMGLNLVKAPRDGTGLSTERINLSESLIDSPEFRKIWDEDFCEFMAFTLLRPLGYKLRHDLAHGLISFEDCNFINSLMIIHLFIGLSARVVPQEKSK